MILLETDHNTLLIGHIIHKMNIGKDELDEPTTCEENSLRSATSFILNNSDEDHTHEEADTQDEGAVLYQRVVEWLKGQGIEKGDPSSIQEDYITQHRQNVLAALQTPQLLTSSEPLPNASEKKSALKLRRPPALKVCTAFP